MRNAERGQPRREIRRNPRTWDRRLHGREIRERRDEKTERSESIGESV